MCDSRTDLFGVLRDSVTRLARALCDGMADLLRFVGHCMADRLGIAGYRLAYVLAVACNGMTDLPGVLFDGGLGVIDFVPPGQGEGRYSTQQEQQRDGFHGA